MDRRADSTGDHRRRSAAAAYIKASDRDENVDMDCIRDFIEAVDFRRTLTWNLYLRDGQWVLYGAKDGREAEPYDGGTYSMPHIDLELALFTSTAPDIRDDIWLYPSIEEDTLTLGFMHMTQWRKEADPFCFVQAASIVELTNPFVRVS